MVCIKTCRLSSFKTLPLNCMKHLKMVVKLQQSSLSCHVFFFFKDKKMSVSFHSPHATQAPRHWSSMGVLSISQLFIPEGEYFISEGHWHKNPHSCEYWIPKCQSGSQEENHWKQTFFPKATLSYLWLCSLIEEERIEFFLLSQSSPCETMLISYFPLS